MKNLLIFLLFIESLSSVKAQQSLTLYNMQAIPQAMYVNPGAMPLTNINIGLPGISSNYINYGNTGFTPHDLIKKDDNGGLLVGQNNFLGKLRPTNNLNINVHTDLLSVGFKVKKRNYFSFNVTERVDFRLAYTKDFFSFLVNGNGASANLNRDMNLSLGLDATHFREWGFNYTREVRKDKLTIGARFKILSGIENVNTEGTHISMNTNSQYYTITANANIQANTSCVDTNAQKHTNTILGFDPSRKNRGYAIDLGATYKATKKFTFTASVIDLGFITWKDYITSYKSTNSNTSVQYNGVNINQAINDSANLGQSIQKLGDSLQKSFAIKENSSSYRTMLTTQFYLGSNYWLNGKNNIGLVLHGQYANKQFSPALALSINNKIGRWFSASLSYAILNRSYDNVGLGLSFTGPVQFYIVSDNIMSVLVYDKYKTEKSSVMVPAYSKNMNVRFGINITIGKIPNDKDKDGVPDKTDACPDIAGPTAFKGCPDRDGDSIPDKDDSCPDIYGLKSIRGCPDKDGDGITDFQDKCPNEKGPAEFNGCPDRDDDRIIDHDDECPDQAGLPQFMGCPDKDGDGIPDKYDACPNEPGSPLHKGCPDKDKDGIVDKEDACPHTPGPVENKGCPWPDADNDGVLDKEDDCPTVFGVKEFKGCPPVEIKPAEQKILEKAFSSLEFATGNDIIKKTSYPSLNQLAALVKKHTSDWTLQLSGHTDNQGGAQENMLLSEKRAVAVKKYLVSKGVREDKILTDWFGQTQPVAGNDNESGRKKNRRVEMKLLYK